MNYDIRTRNYSRESLDARFGTYEARFSEKKTIRTNYPNPFN